jgi:hypothetical protein
MIAEILWIYLGVTGRDILNNQLFPFRDILSVPSHSLEPDPRRSISASQITFRTRYFSLSSLPLKKSYRASPQLCFLLLNFNSSNRIVTLCWLMSHCAIERVDRRGAPIDIGLEKCSDWSEVRWTDDSGNWNNWLSNWAPRQ